jgi:hypothetical protein
MSQQLEPTKESFTALKSWPEYKIETKKFLVNKKDTGLQAIYKNGNFVKMLTQKYEVLPNEDVFKITDDIAKKVTLNGQSALPLDTQSHEWYHAPKEGHIITNPEETQAIGMYVFPKGFDVDGKEIKIGFAAKNSIDGKWAFSASVLSFRTICQNMMMHIGRSSFMGIGSGQLHGVESTKDMKDLGEREVIALSVTSKRHTKLLTEGNNELVKSSIQGVIDSGLKVVEQYRNLAKLRMNQKMADTIAKYMPRNITKELDWIDLDDKTNIKFDAKTTQWNAFNDITEKLTHESTNFRRTLRSMQIIDRTFGTNL